MLLSYLAGECTCKMGDPRDLCPHLDSIGEVTKEDLLLKSKVKASVFAVQFHPFCF